MSHSRHESFLDLTEAAFSAYAEAFINAKSTATKRQQAFAYLQGVSAVDAQTISTSQATLDEQRRLQRKQQRALEGLIRDAAFDFSGSDLFTDDAPLSDAALLAQLSTAGSSTFLKNKTVGEKLVISADNVTVDGQATGDARSGTLATTVVVNGVLEIAGDNAVVRGIQFNADAVNSIRFTGASQNVTIEDCIFDGQDGAEYAWWNGIGEFLSGDVTIKNCLVKNYSDWWMLADLNTESSGTPTRALGTVVVRKNLFQNCSGSFAVRGKLDEPITKATIKNNVFEHTTAHSLFWDSIEVSGAVRRVVCTGNVGSIDSYGDPVTGKRGFGQFWSKSSQPFKLIYRDNVLTGYRVGLKVAMSQPAFFCPSQDPEDWVAEVKDSDLTNVDYGASFLYKNVTSGSALRWIPQTPAGDYNPGNVGTYPAPPDLTVKGAAVQVVR